MGSNLLSISGVETGIVSNSKHVICIACGASFFLRLHKPAHFVPVDIIALNNIVIKRVLLCHYDDKLGIYLSLQQFV